MNAKSPKYTNMKTKLMYSLLLSFLLPFALVAQQGGNFKLKGTIKGLNKGIVKMNLLPPSNALVGTAEINNETFILTGKVDQPQKTFIFVEDPSGEVYTAFGMFIEKGELEVYYTPERKYKPQYIKAPFQQDIIKYEEYMRSLPESQQIDKYRVEASEALKKGDNDRVEQIDKDKRILTWKVINKLMSFRKDAALSQSAAFHVCNLGYSLPLEEQPKVFKLFKPELEAKSLYLKEFKENYEKEFKLGKGQIAPNFTLEDLDGKKYSLSDFKGKHVFVQFSASWCGWCKKEIPFIRDAREKLKGKDIVFITINMDKKKTLWENEIKHENITWLCLSNLEGMDSQIAKDYNINSIPASFVVSPDGHIIERNLRGTGVYDFLKTVVK